MGVVNYLSDHLIELTGFLFGVIYVVLVIREHYLCWVAGSINVIIYIVVFYQNSLYGMSLLQLFYLFMSIYGFLLWRGLYKPPGGTGAQQIRNIPVKLGWIVAAMVFIAAIVTGYLLSYTDSTIPRIDGATTILGLAATWMTARKFIENWLVWIVNDLVCVLVYLWIGLYLTAALYLVFFVMAIVGYLAWRKRIDPAKS